MYGHDIFGHIMWFMAVSKYIICCKKKMWVSIQWWLQITAKKCIDNGPTNPITVEKIS